ncbi:MAG: GntR family transcriptional regulator [Planktomarina sp.]|nr:GntR family transcriptional regulator [Planktomarina sp.]
MSANNVISIKSKPNDIAPIQNVPLRTMVANRLREAILSGQLPLGSSLVETELAEQLNVSRAPIREAIQILENDGLIETIAYKGKRVKPLTTREVEEIFSLRELYEVMAVRRILESSTPVDALHQHCSDMTAAAKVENFSALTAADEAFHRTLISLADHDLLMASWNNLYLRIHQMMAIRNNEKRNLTEVARNHPPIVQALEANDANLAIKLITDHTRILAALDLVNLIKEK